MKKEDGGRIEGGRRGRRKEEGEEAGGRKEGGRVKREKRRRGNKESKK